MQDRTDSNYPSPRTTPRTADGRLTEAEKARRRAARQASADERWRASIEAALARAPEHPTEEQVRVIRRVLAAPGR